MGKIKTRLIGDEETEKKQKKEQKEKAAEKKVKKQKPAEKKEDKQVKTEETKAEVKKTAVEKKPKVIKQRGKRYLENSKKIDKTKIYTLEQAVELLKKIKFAKFDESMELHLNVDKEGIKGEAELPYSTGKTVRIRIIDDKTLAELEKGKIEFDILITHPSFMPKLAKFAKMLGPKGLMPNPKAGTISPKPEEVAKKFEKGALRWKTEPKAPLIHQMIGKISFEDNKLVENARIFIKSVGKAHILKAVMKTTMSPSVKLDLTTLFEA